MPRHPSASRPAAFLALLLALPPATDSAGQGAAGSRYRMYRNPPATRLVLLPLEAPHLGAPARQRLTEALARELRGLEGFRLVSLSAGDSAAAASAAPESLAALGRRRGPDLALRARVDSGSSGIGFDARLLDVRTGAERARLREEARGPLDSLLARLPSAVRGLTQAPEVRSLRCDDDMALVPAADSARLPAPPAAGAEGRGSFGPGAFCVDLYEYPNQPSGEPLVGKTWGEAAALCASRGKRLCSEAEWELACGGWEGRAYPYGDVHAADRCNTGSRTIRLAGSHKGCRSPFGAYDLSGNVYEWTATAWSGRHAAKVVKGGNWASGGESSTCMARFGADPEIPSGAVGFRCCQSLEP